MFYQEGYDIGVENGIEQGEAKREAELIGKMLKSGKSAEEISKIFEIDRSVVQEVEKKLCANV
jgi:predicted transposase YdaD